MSVKIDPSGRRWVQAEVEVPGTPEQVWQAIATGPGISSWFVPTDVEEREGGETVSHLVRAWTRPPRSPPGSRPTASPPKAGTWARPRRRSPPSGSWRRAPAAPAWSAWSTASLPAATSGTTSSRASRPAGPDSSASCGCTSSISRECPAPRSGSWARSRRPNPSTSSGTRWQARSASRRPPWASTGPRQRRPQATPPLAGLVEWIWDMEKLRELVLRLDEPAPGIATLGAYEWGGKVHVAVNFYLYGDRAPAAAVRDEPLWQEWVKELFPAVVSDVAC